MNTEINFHSYKKYANTSHEWETFDSKERFDTNLKSNYSLLKLNGWTTKPVLYKYNSDGFRCNNFNPSKNSILFLGCSLTFGTGLPIEETYGYLTSKKVNLEFYNLGLGGSSNDTAFRLGYYYIPILKPKIVVLGSPENTRIELCKNKEIFYYRSQLEIYKMDSFYKKWLLDDTNSLLNQQKNILALENICSKYNIKFLYFDAPKMFLIESKVENDYARDLIHPGSATHLNVSEKIISMI